MRPSKFDYSKALSSSGDYSKALSSERDYTQIFFSDTSDYDNDFECFDEHKITMRPNLAPQNYKFDVDYEMNLAYKRNESKIMSETIRPIGNGIYTYYNSLNIIVGAQGKGKSHIVLRDIIQISRLKDTNIHQIVYISKNGVINDSTFEAQRELINLPVKVVSDANAESYLKELDLWKELYSKVSGTGLKLTQEKLEKMFKFLSIDKHFMSGTGSDKHLCLASVDDKLGKSGVQLNTIILCEDFIKSKLLKSAYFTNFITQLRHKHAIVYVNVQFFKAIPTDYKNNCTSFFIFNGFSRQKMGYIYQQVMMPLEFEDLWRQYNKMKNHDFVLVNTREGSIEFVKFNK